MSIKRLQTYFFLAFCMMSSLVKADAVAIPQALEPWRDWVLHDQKQLDCPWLMQGGVGQRLKEQRWCFWPKQLAIDTDRDGARFRFNMTVYQNGDFPLPGSKQYWPVDVRVNGSQASLMDKNGNPMIYLNQGEHTITGRFNWSKPPSVLRVPKEVALITLNDKPGTYLNGRDEQLVLSRKSSRQVATQQDSLRLEVYRLLSDGLPMRLETQLHLQVSGKAREVELGLAAMPQSSLLDIRSPIPTRLEENGNLRLQVKPGQYVITLSARIAQRHNQFEVKAQTKYWPTVEYWSFKEDTYFRTVTLSGAPSIDTSMIPIPSQWRQYPTYRLSTANKAQTQQGSNQLVIATNQRGDASTQENRLKINRDIWLDFNGDAYTALDNIKGNMYQGWRLNASNSLKVGRASVDGSPVLVTVTEQQEGKGEQGNTEAEQSGVEVRSQRVNLEALSRIEKGGRLLMSGWDTLFDQVNVELHLPPGWKVLHISGAERVQGSWLTKWDLWDLFLVLVLIALTHKLLNTKAAIIAGIMLLLSYKLPDSPVVFWPVLLALVGLMSVATGRWLKGAQVASVIASFLMVVTVIGFCVQQFRFAVYPYLEHQGVELRQSSWGMASGGHNQADFAMEDTAEEMLEPQLEMKQMARKSLSSVAPTAYQKPRKKAPKIDLYQVSENDRLQTGPGLPNWHWNSVRYSRSGPVSADSSVDIYYVTPWMSRLWHVLSALLVVLFDAVILYSFSQRWSGRPDQGQSNGSDSKNDSDTNTETNLGEKGFASVNILASMSAIFTALSAVLIVMSLWSPQTLAQSGDFPPEHLLKTLKQRLTQPPECAPYCAALHSARLEARADELELSFTADIKAPMAIALPGEIASSAAKQVMWQSSDVRVDNRPAVLSRFNKKLILALEPGRHRIKMRGPLTSDSVQVSFPQPIRSLTWFSSSWDVEGLVDNRVLGGSLQLTAKPIKNKVKPEQVSDKNEQEVLIPNAIKPFVIVNRKLIMGKRWTMTTEVSRLAPTKGAFSINIPLLKKEQVLSEFLRVKRGVKAANGEVQNQALLSFKPNQSVVRWESRFDPVSELKLTAAESDQFVENWRIVPGALWHVSYDGVLPVKQGQGQGALNPLWKPWANETLVVKVQRPEGVKGQIQTVESVSLEYNAASDVKDSTLSLDVRASQGERFEVGLPEGAKITALYHDNRSLNVPRDNKVVVQLKPGLQQILVEFQLLKQDGLSVVDSTPTIDLANGAANIRIDYQLGHDRWPLYLSGPLIGPAMLFWGVLFVIIAAAFILTWLQKRFALPVPIALTGWLLLGVGLSTVNSFGLIFIALFFILMALRIKTANQGGFDTWSDRQFNAMQVGLIGLSLLSLLMLVVAIPDGLLSTPQMQVTGNGSYAFSYNWYQDRIVDGEFPVATVVSVPLLVYRLVMLLWSLWLAMKLVKWVVWAWNGFNTGGVWKSHKVEASTLVKPDQDKKS